MALNTLQIATRLKAAEKDGRTAEEIALVFGELEEERYARLVTRDVLELELAKVRGEIEKLRTEVQGEFGKLRVEMDKLRVDVKHDLTLRLGAMIAAAVAVMGGLRFFF